MAPSRRLEPSEAPPWNMRRVKIDYVQPPLEPGARGCAELLPYALRGSDPPRHCETSWWSSPASWRRGRPVILRTRRPLRTPSPSWARCSTACGPCWRRGRRLLQRHSRRSANLIEWSSSRQTCPMLPSRGRVRPGAWSEAKIHAVICDCHPAPAGLGSGGRLRVHGGMVPDAVGWRTSPGTATRKPNELGSGRAGSVGTRRPPSEAPATVSEPGNA